MVKEQINEYILNSPVNSFCLIIFQVKVYELSCAHTVDKSYFFILLNGFALFHNDVPILSTAGDK